MATLTLTGRGQVTFRREVLRHLGLKPGDRIEVELLPDGKVSLRAAAVAGRIGDFVGMLAGKSREAVSIEAMNEAIAEGWSRRA